MKLSVDMRACWVTRSEDDDGGEDWQRWSLSSYHGGSSARSSIDPGVRGALGSVEPREWCNGVT